MQPGACSRPGSRNAHAMCWHVELARSLVQHAQRHPVRRVLEARGVQDQDQVLPCAVPANGAEVAVACDSKGGRCRGTFERWQQRAHGNCLLTARQIAKKGSPLPLGTGIGRGCPGPTRDRDPPAVPPPPRPPPPQSRRPIPPAGPPAGAPTPNPAIPSLPPARRPGAPPAIPPSHPSRRPTAGPGFPHPKLVFRSAPLLSDSTPAIEEP